MKLWHNVLAALGQTVRAIRQFFSKSDIDYEAELGLNDDVDRALGDEAALAEAEKISPHRKVDPRVVDEVKDALQEWHDATTYFESVSDPDLVDFAIYDMEATRRKYMYLIKRTRSERPNMGGIDVMGGA